MAERAPCGVLLRDGSPCRGTAMAAWGGQCEHHGLATLADVHGWRVRGGRRPGVYVADKAGRADVYVSDRGDRVLVANTPDELARLLEQEQKA